MLERDLKDLCQIRESAGSNYPDYPLLLTSLSRVMAVAERMLPQSPFSPPLQPTIRMDQKKPGKIDMPGASRKSGSAASCDMNELVGEFAGMGKSGPRYGSHEGSTHAARGHACARAKHSSGRTGSSDEETHGRTSSDEEVRRMNHHLRTVSLRSALESPSLSLSLSRLTMEDGRHVEGIMGMVAEGETYIPEEELEGDLAFQHVQSMLLHEQSPTKGFSSEERELIDVQGLVEVFEAEEIHRTMQCQICLVFCNIRGSSKHSGRCSERDCDGHHMKAVEEELGGEELMAEADVTEMTEDAKLAHEVKEFLTQTERVALLEPSEPSVLEGFINTSKTPRGNDTETPRSKDTETPRSKDATTSSARDTSVLSSELSTERTEGGTDMDLSTERTDMGTDMDQSTERTEGASEEVELLSAEREEALVRYLMKLPCGHIFHEVCMERWFAVGRTCPICRQEVYVADWQTGAAASGPSTHRSLESGSATDSHRTPRDDDDGPKHMHCLRPREVMRPDGSHSRSAAPTPLRPAVPSLALGAIKRNQSRGSETSSPMNSTRTLSARSGHSGHHSARLTMSPRSAFTDAPPRSYRSQESDA